MPQPTQFRRVRSASCSTASLQPRDGWVATNLARICVTGGASRSAFVSCAMRAVSPSVRVAENDAHLVFAGEAEGNGSAGGVVVGDDRGETLSRLKHERRVEGDDRRMLPVGAFVDGRAIARAAMDANHE